MKILYYHRTLADGAEGIHIRCIVDCFRDLEHETKVISILGKNGAVPLEEGHVSPKSWKGKLIEKFRFLLPDILYELAEIFINILAKRIIKKAIKEFQPDFIYERYSSYGYSCSKMANKYQIPIILEVNVPYYHYKKNWEKLYFPFLLRSIEAKILKRVDHIIVVSTTLKKILSAYNISEGKITVMPNGVDVDRFKPLHKKAELKRHYKVDAEILLGFVGMIRRWHKLENLFDVLHEINLTKYNAKMIIVGFCDFMKELQEYVKRLGESESILFTGRVPHTEIPNFIEMMNITISSAAVPYSSPMKILEYMSMGTCVIAPDMENIRDIITPNVTGILFTPDNWEDLKAKITFALQEKELRERIANNAYVDAQNNRTWEKNARGVINIYENILKVKDEAKLVSLFK